MEKLETCPLCYGSGEKEISNGSAKGHIMVCWRCHGTGKIPKVEELRGLLFEAMIQDSVNLRQKLLWTEVESDLLKAGEEQIKCFKENIAAGIEEDYIIEEYNGHLERFLKWFQIFKMDLQLIVALRNGSESFTDNNYNFIDTNSWIVRKKNEYDKY